MLSVILDGPEHSAFARRIVETAELNGLTRRLAAGRQSFDSLCSLRAGREPPAAK